MNLKSILDDLAIGEFRQVFTGYFEGECISECKIPGIIRRIQLALTQLYTEFKIKEGYLKIKVNPDKREYILDKTFAESNPIPGIEKYIEDQDSPYMNDLLKIERIYTQKKDVSVNTVGLVPFCNRSDFYEYEFTLNMVNDRMSIRTPQINIIRIPEYSFMKERMGQDVEYLDLFYRANHVEIDILQATETPEFVYIELPEQFRQALLLYIAARETAALSPVNGIHQGSMYLQMYLQEVQRLKGLGLDIDTEYYQNEVLRDGWV